MINMKITFNLQNFEPVPEGTRKMTITEAKAVPSGKPNKIETTFKDIETGRTLKNNYGLTNSGGLNAFGYLCRVAFNMKDMDEFDTDNINKLVGKTVLCEVVHTEGTQPREDGSLPIFANIKKVISLVGEEQKSATANTGTSPRASIPVGNDLD